MSDDTDPPFGPGDVDVAAQETLFRRYLRVDGYRLRHRTYAGGWSATLDREVLERGHAVAAVLYDPDRDLLVLIEQFRIGALAAAASPWLKTGPWLVECVAGIIEDGESPEDVVRRESQEEAGCTVGEVIHACTYMPSPGASSETIQVFCGQVDAATVGGVHGVAGEGEDIRAMAVPVETAMAWIDEGRLVSSLVLIALQWFRRHHADIRARWAG